MEATLYTLRYVTALWLLAILLTGFILGFGQVLALLVGSVLLMWLYWRIVVMRPRPALAGVYVGNFYGCDFYGGMEA